MTLDIKDFYLNELLEIPEYMMVKLSDIQLLSLSLRLLAWPTPAVCCLSLLKNSLWIEAEWYDMSQRPGRSPGQTATMQMQLYPLSSRMLRETRCSSS
jgi:hypothetical protein